LIVAKATRVFAASLRREHRSEPAKPALCRVSFVLATYIWTSKYKSLALQRETKVQSNS
jgi:hypothetical protein